MASPKEDTEKKPAQSWDDQLAMALPRTSTYFNAVRTEAYENRNPVSNYIEFWVSLRVDQEQDKWRVMHYVIFDLDLNDGKFKSEVASKNDCSFAESIWHLSKFNSMASAMGTNKPLEMMTEKFPLDKFPEMKVYFFDLENYKVAANIEGIAFDEAERPYRRVEGKVVCSASFTRSELNKSIVSPALARENPKVSVRIEDGVLSDIFNSSSATGASLDDVLKVGQALACLDKFAECMGAFYVGIQKILNKDDKFDKIQCLTEAEKKNLYKAADKLLNTESPDLYGLLNGELRRAAEQLIGAKALGVHVEPFQKHLAECELYVHLLEASMNLSKYRASLQSPHGTDLYSLTKIQQAVKAAQGKFVDLGGTAEHFDRLQAWVANDKKEVIPPWVVTWFDRYYDQRQKTMKRVQAGQSTGRAVETMSVKVKPPIVE